MSKLDELLQSYVNKPYEELLGMARSSLSRLVPLFTKVWGDKEGSAFVLQFLCTALAADGQLSQLEYRFLCDVVNIDSADSAVKLVALACNEASRALVDKVFDSIDNNDVKADMVNLFLCCVSVDETITKDETALFLRLLS